VTHSLQTNQQLILCWSFTYHKPIISAWCTSIKTDIAEEISSMLITQYTISVNIWNFVRYYRNGSSPWFHEIKMNRHAFMSINRMRAGHSSLKANLSRFKTVSMAECECGDRLQTKEHISSGIVNCTKTKGQQRWTFCLGTAKKNTQSQLQSS
jgi:hypothetical protein